MKICYFTLQKKKGRTNILRIEKALHIDSQKEL